MTTTLHDIRPQQAANAAALHADVRVREIREMDELRAVADLFVARWNTQTPHSPLSPNLLRAFACTGNYVAGAYRHGRLMGASVAFRQHGEGGPGLFSQTTSVTPGTEGRGVGYALKLHQRAWGLARGLDSVEWTYDPLVRRNAYFNLVKLGALGVGYLPNFYGTMRDDINREDDSDRVLVRWSLRAPRAVRAASGPPGQPDADRAAPGLPGPPDADRPPVDGARTLLMVGPGARPVTLDDDPGELALCQVPRDIVAMRAAEPGQAKAWREALRTALTSAFRRGLVVRSITPTGWYVLAKERS